LEVG
jgi:hypothetical protein